MIDIYKSQPELSREDMETIVMDELKHPYYDV